MIIGGFAGPGGWAEGARALDLDEVGIELDEAACRTRAAAGHKTIRASMVSFPVEQLAGKVTGQIHSPPCIVWSAAGSRGGIAVTAECAGLIKDLFAGLKTRAKRRNAMARALRDADWPPPRTRPTRFGRTMDAETKPKTPVHLTREQRSAAIRKAVLSASLVAEPARFIHACPPEWVALEQVPAVLPLWNVYAEELRKMGYSVWCGKLNAADYSVPQTRERAILIASRVRRVSCPPPTHYDPRKGDQLFGERWVSMAAALGWGATGRGAPTVTAGGTSHGGYEPFGMGARDGLRAEQAAGRWALRRERSAFRAEHDTARDRALLAPAPTVSGGGQARMSWVLRTDNQAESPMRLLDQPSATIKAGHSTSERRWVLLQDDKRLADVKFARGQVELDSVRITVREAAVLQSFRPDYPWQGTKTAQYTQVGNAVPPVLAMHVLAEATGIPVASDFQYTEGDRHAG